MRTPAALALALALATLVAALAFAPFVSVLILSDGHARILVPLADGQTYTYSYVNSIYNAPVEERHVRSSERLRIQSAVSPDIRAVEYFRWEGEPHRAGSDYEQAAPANEQRQLVIRVTPQFHQRIAGPEWDVDLAERFGDGVVRVSPARLPLASALLRGWAL